MADPWTEEYKRDWHSLPVESQENLIYFFGEPVPHSSIRRELNSIRRQTKVHPTMDAILNQFFPGAA